MIIKEQIDCDVVDVCNLACKDCSRQSPRFGKNLYSFEEFRNDLFRLSTVFRCSTIHICGGEPLILGEKLRDYVDAIRECKLASQVGIVTNGLLAKRNAELLKIFDVIRISLYNHSRRDEVKEWFDKNKENYKGMYLYNTTEFYEMFTPTKLSDNVAQEAWDRCRAKFQCNNLYRGVYYRCFGAARYHLLLDAMGIENIHHLGCNLYEDNLEERLQKYIDGACRIETCSYCYGDLKLHPWSQETVEKVI